MRLVSAVGILWLILEESLSGSAFTGPLHGLSDTGAGRSGAGFASPTQFSSSSSSSSNSSSSNSSNSDSITMNTRQHQGKYNKAVGMIRRLGFQQQVSCAPCIVECAKMQTYSTTYVCIQGVWMCNMIQLRCHSTRTDHRYSNVARNPLQIIAIPHQQSALGVVHQPPAVLVANTVHGPPATSNTVEYSTKVVRVPILSAPGTLGTGWDSVISAAGTLGPARTQPFRLLVPRGQRRTRLFQLLIPLGLASQSFQLRQ